MIGTAVVSNAQKNNSETPFRKGSVTVNLGVGIGNDYKGDYKYYNSGNGFGTKSSLEFGLWQAGPGVVSLGAEVGGSFSSGGRYNDFRSRTIIVAGRSAWHYGWKVKGLDTYAGLAPGLGFHHYQYKNDIDYASNTVIPVLGVFAGASYFVSPKFGFNAEAGYDITNFQIGLVFKLK